MINHFQTLLSMTTCGATAGQGMGGEAVKAYLQGLAKEPDNAGLRARPYMSVFTAVFVTFVPETT
jgi:hypothetical protein